MKHRRGAEALAFQNKGLQARSVVARALQFQPVDLGGANVELSPKDRRGASGAF